MIKNPGLHKCGMVIAVSCAPGATRNEASLRYLRQSIQFIPAQLQRRMIKNPITFVYQEF